MSQALSQTQQNNSPQNLVQNLGQFRDMSLTLTNLFQYLTIMSPFLMVFFIVMISIVNNTIIKGLIFLMGIVIATFIIYLIKTMIKDKQHPLADPLCNLLPFPFTTKGKTIENQRPFILGAPLMSTSLLGFIVAYMIFPMWVHNSVNPPLLLILILFLVINAVTELWRLCSSLFGVILSVLVGSLLGVGFYGLIAVSGNQKLAFFSEIPSSAQGCHKPSQQKFKCDVFKKGVPLS